MVQRITRPGRFLLSLNASGTANANVNVASANQGKDRRREGAAAAAGTSGTSGRGPLASTPTRPMLSPRQATPRTGGATATMCRPI